MPSRVETQVADTSHDLALLLPLTISPQGYNPGLSGLTSPDTCAYATFSLRLHT